MTRVFSTPYMNREIQHKNRRCESTSADRTVQMNERDNTSSQDKTRQDKAREDKSRQYNTIQDKTRQDKTRQDKKTKTRQDS